MNRSLALDLDMASVTDSGVHAPHRTTAVCETFCGIVHLMSAAGGIVLSGSGMGTDEIARLHCCH